GMLWRAPMAGRLSRLGTTKSPYYRKSRRDADAKAIPRSTVDRYAQRRLWQCCRAARGSLDSRSATGRRQSHARDDGIFDHRTRDARTIGGKVGAVVGDALRGPHGMAIGAENPCESRPSRWDGRQSINFGHQVARSMGLSQPRKIHPAMLPRRIPLIATG